MTVLSERRAYVFLVLAAVLWSTSGTFAKLLALPGPTLALFRTIFAGLCLLPFLRGRRRRLRPAMFPMVACFAAMSATFLTAMTLTSAANTIFLQYTAPLWMLAGSVLWLGERIDRAGVLALALGLSGVLVIVVGGPVGEATGMALALLAGVFFAGVGLYLRYLRGEDPVWLTALNHVGSIPLLAVLAWLAAPESGFVWPAGGQWLGLFAFGALQMALPYWLFSRALEQVPAHDAGIVCLLEPVLNAALAAAIAGERPGVATLIGGTILLSSVALRALGARSGAARA
jgi:drug/metabolite transporter (DMT)-like permease